MQQKQMIRERTGNENETRKIQWNLDITKAKGLAEFVCYNGVSLHRFFFIYFTITGAKNVVHYSEEFGM